MDPKIVSVLIGVVLGWLLSQVTDVIKRKNERQKKIEAIYTEFEDLSAWLYRLRESSKYNIMLSLNKKIATNSPALLHKFILDEYFHEICMFLPKGVRIGMVDAYSQIEHINEKIKQLTQLLERPLVVKSQEVAKMYTALFCCAFETKCKINHLLRDRSGDMNKLRGMAKNMKEELESHLSQGEIANII